jgi:serine/threonine protein phosphatase PrpC
LEQPARPLTVAQLRSQATALAAAGAMPPIAGSAVLRVDGRVRAVASAAFGPYTATVDSVSLCRIHCGGVEGVLVALAGGNFKDAACCVASATVAATFHEMFARAQLYEADIPTLLRRAMLNANEQVHELSLGPIGDVPTGTAVGTRKSLKGIGAAVTALAVLPHRAWVAHIGDGRAFLLRAKDARQLTVDHTLFHDPGYRARAQALAPGDASQIVLRVLGGKAAPEFDVTRVDLRPGDRLVLGNAGVSLSLAQWMDLERAPTAEDGISLASEQLTDSCMGPPPTIAVVDILGEGRSTGG